MRLSLWLAPLCAFAALSVPAAAGTLHQPPAQPASRLLLGPAGGHAQSSVVPEDVRAAAFAYRAQHPLRFPAGRTGDAIGQIPPTLSSWLTDNGGFIWHLNAAGNLSPPAQTPITSCAAPLGAKVDRHKNLWAVCNGTSTINMYAAPVTLASPVNTILQDTGASGVTFAPIDVAVDHNGDVFATNRCGASGCGSAGQISFWTAAQVNTCFTSGNNPAMCGPSGLIYDPLIYQAYFLDVNQNGTDLFVDYFDSTNTAGLDEIASPLGTPAITNLIPANPIPFAYPGGVEVSRFTPGNRRLTLVDQSSRAVYQLGLPPGTFPGAFWTSIATASPNCRPVSGGYGMQSKHLGLGDARCFAADVGLNMNTGSPGWTQHASSSYTLPIADVYLPSDKI
jgi:hypothetical protein